jgi:hypothetical protein
MAWYISELMYNQDTSKKDCFTFTSLRYTESDKVPPHDATYVRQTSDSGYILIGKTESHAIGKRDVWLVKTDANGNQQWNKTFGGVNEENGWSVQQTTDSGYILAGDTELYRSGDYDAWLIKTDVNGNQQWNKTFGGAF